MALSVSAFLWRRLYLSLGLPSVHPRKCQAIIGCLRALKSYQIMDYRGYRRGDSFLRWDAV